MAGEDEDYKLEVNIPSWLREFFQDPYNIAFLVVLLVAIYFRAININTGSIWPDTANHLWMVETYLSPEMLEEISRQGAILFITITKILSFFVQPFLAGKLASMIYSLVGITSMYFLGRELINEEAGLAAALVLAFVPIFWMQSTRPLLDSNITSVIALVMLCLVKYERTNKKSWAISLALSMVAAATTKLVGVLVFPMIGLYYLISYRLELWEMIKERKDFQIFVGIVFASGILLMIFNYFSAGVVTARTGGKVAKKAASGGGGFPFHTFYFRQIPSMISWLGVLLLIPGLYVSLKRFREGEKIWLGLYLIAAAWFGFFSQHSVQSPRYILPAIPLLILVALVGVPKLFGKINWEVALVGLLMVAFIYPAGASVIQDRSYSYTGYQDAGEFLRSNIGERDVVIAGAKRQMRLFTGEPYLRNGGHVINNKKKWNRSDFVRKVQEFNRERGGVWLVVDRWEYTQPDWIYPPNGKKIQWLQKIGFKLVHAVEKPVPTKQGLQKGPVVMVFRYTGSPSAGS